MEIWIILDGEKTGPLHDFEIRRKIEKGELLPTTPAWHEGLAAWQPLAEIGIFRDEFHAGTERHETSEDDDNARPEGAPEPPPPPLPPPCYGRRFWARWFDLAIYGAVWWLAMWAAGQNIEAALLNPWIMFLQFVPWFAIEALLIHHFSTTPGKRLLGLRVVNHNGSRLDLTAACRRSMRVLFTGIGFGWAPLALMCHALSLFIAKRLGSTLWDHAGGHRVTVEPISPLKLTAFVFLFFTALQLQVMVVSPYTTRHFAEEFPKLQAEFDRWRLPQRN